MTAQTLTLTDRILAGQIPEGTIYTDLEWTEHAQMARDCEDEEELRWMLDQRPARGEWEDSQERFRHNRHFIERGWFDAVSPMRATAGMGAGR